MNCLLCCCCGVAVRVGTAARRKAPVQMRALCTAFRSEPQSAFDSSTLLRERSNPLLALMLTSARGFKGRAPAFVWGKSFSAQTCYPRPPDSTQLIMMSPLPCSFLFGKLSRCPCADALRIEHQKVLTQCADGRPMLTFDSNVKRAPLLSLSLHA